MLHKRNMELLIPSLPRFGTVAMFVEPAFQSEPNPRAPGALNPPARCHREGGRGGGGREGGREGRKKERKTEGRQKRQKQSATWREGSERNIVCLVCVRVCPFVCLCVLSSSSSQTRLAEGWRTALTGEEQELNSRTLSLWCVGCFGQ